MKKFYFLFCNTYNHFFSFLEKLFFKNKSKIKLFSSKIETKGFELIRLDKNPILIKKSNNQVIVNKYMKKDIMFTNDIIDLIKNYFIELNLAEIITERTGYEYSIDYLINYTILNVPDDDKGEWYANHWHNDKPFTKNTLKMIIPLVKMNSSLHGGIEILDIEQTNQYSKEKLLPNENDYYVMKADVNEVLLFLPNQCFHKAGNPSRDLPRSQIMLQLNPSDRWKINNNLEKKQYKSEPKFPYFSYLLDKKLKLKILKN